MMRALPAAIEQLSELYTALHTEGIIHFREESSPIGPFINCPDKSTQICAFGCIPDPINLTNKINYHDIWMHQLTLVREPMTDQSGDITKVEPSLYWVVYRNMDE